MTIGEAIRNARHAKGLTQNELAGRLGVTQALVGHYERGLRKPKLETLNRIASALEVSAWDLLSRADDDIRLYSMEEIYGVLVDTRKKIMEIIGGLDEDELGQALKILETVFPHRFP